MAPPKEDPPSRRPSPSVDDLLAPIMKGLDDQMFRRREMKGGGLFGPGPVDVAGNDSDNNNSYPARAARRKKLGLADLPASTHLRGTGTGYIHSLPALPRMTGPVDVADSDGPFLAGRSSRNKKFSLADLPALPPMTGTGTLPTLPIIRRMTRAGTGPGTLPPRVRLSTTSSSPRARTANEIEAALKQSVTADFQTLDDKFRAAAAAIAQRQQRQQRHENTLQKLRDNSMQTLREQQLMQKLRQRRGQVEQRDDLAKQREMQAQTLRDIQAKQLHDMQFLQRIEQLKKAVDERNETKVKVREESMPKLAQPARKLVIKSKL